MSQPSRVRPSICWSVIAGVNLVAYLALVEFEAAIATASASDPSDPPGPSALVIALYCGAVAPFLVAQLDRRSRAELPPHGSAYLEAFTVYVILANLAVFFLTSKMAIHLFAVFAPVAGVVYAFVACSSVRRPLVDLGWRIGRRAWIDVTTGVLVGLVVVAVFYARRKIVPADAGLLVSPAGLSLLLSTALWTPIAEETLYRGLVYRYLRDRWRWPAPVVANAGIFAVMHLPSRMAPAFIAGLFYALLRERSGSLLGPITAHATVNLAVLLAF